MSDNHNHINYIELPAVDLAKTKEFYSSVFDWSFMDWGPQYIGFKGAGIGGGFQAAGEVKPQPNGVLVVLYADALETCLGTVEKAGGEIVKPIFEFPGGRRFHFKDPNGNELAVWSE